MPPGEAIPPGGVASFFGLSPPSNPRIQPVKPPEEAGSPVVGAIPAVGGVPPGGAIPAGGGVPPGGAIPPGGGEQAGGAMRPGAGAEPGGAGVAQSGADAEVTRYDIENNVNIINANENRVIFFIKSLGG